MTGITGLGNLTQTNTMMNHTMQVEETNRFNALVKAAKSSSSADTNGTVSSEQISIRDTRLNGEFTSDYSGTFKSEADKTAKASGFAANSVRSQGKTIDKTSKLKLIKQQNLQDLLQMQKVSRRQSTKLLSFTKNHWNLNHSLLK